MGSRLVGSCVLVVSSLFGCEADAPEAELIVVVGTDLVVPTELDRIELRVTQPDGRRLVEEVVLTGAPGDMPRTFFLTPDGPALDPVSIEALGYVGEARVVRRDVVTGYVAGETRALRVELRRSCVDVACGDGATCIVGSCSDPSVAAEDLPFWDGRLSPTPCEAGYADCDPAPGCEARLDSPEHCGACFAACDAATPLCSGLDGVCVDDCHPLAECDGTCVDLGNDEENCGGCGVTCHDPNGTARCEAGACRIDCLDGFHDCGGVCVSDAEVDSCGGSCAPCPTGEHASATCSENLAGDHACGIGCDEGYADCDGDPASGCEVAVYDDPANCGGCGITCGTNAAGNRYGCSASVCDDVIVGIASGARHTCALLHGGEVWCWGDNDTGQLGVDSGGLPLGPSLVPLPARAKVIALGDAHGCARLTDRSVWCWGAGAAGQLGTLDTPAVRAEPLRVQAAIGGEDRFERLAAGRAHTCATGSLGQSYCWGDNSRGQLGIEGVSSVSRPTRVDAGDRLAVDSIVAGGDTTCLLRSLGDLYCFGDNTTGQLGTGDAVPPMSATGRSLGVTWDLASVGEGHVCASPDAGVMSCWGDDRRKQVGFTGARGAETIRAPRQVRVTADTRVVASGGAHTCHAIGSADAPVHCWGANDQRQLDDTGLDTELRTPIATSSGDPLSGVTMLAAGSTHTCALVPPASVYCWGDNAFEQLGRGAGPDDHRASRVPGVGSDD